jgi:hypothetical protein
MHPGPGGRTGGSCGQIEAVETPPRQTSQGLSYGSELLDRYGRSACEVRVLQHRLFVHGDDPVAAEQAAVQMIHETRRLRDLVRNDPGDPPMMDVTSIVELESDEGIENREPGFVWYEERPRRWWQFRRR